MDEGKAKQEAQVGKQRKAGAVRARLLALIIAMQVLMIWWVVDSEVARGIYLICYTLMMPTVLYLLMARVFRRWLPFEDHELLLGYVVLTCTLPVIGFGGLRFLIAGMGYLPFFAQTQSALAKYLPFLGNLPVLHNRQAIYDLYRGNATVPWQAWTMPIAYWSAYLLLLSGIWLCLAGVLRRVWIHHEKLTFPIAVMPLQLQDRHESIFRNPLFWIGFAIPAVLQSLPLNHPAQSSPVLLFTVASIARFVVPPVATNCPPILLPAPAPHASPCMPMYPPVNHPPIP